MKKRLQCFTGAGVLMLLTAALALPVLADEEKPQRGWQQEGEQWIYLDRDGVRQTETWIKGENGARYYLDENGYMAVNTIIKDGDAIYYVNEDGLRVKNQWASELNEDLCDQEVEVLWYYFGKDGKAITDEGKGITLKEGSAERKYFFDSDGHMLSGWQEITNKKNETHIYYLGDENQGYVRKQWQYLEVDDEFFNNPDQDYDSYEMFYFGYEGKMTRSDESELSGKHFLFDENGVLMTGWQPGITASSGDFGINRYYDEETGERAEGWLYAYDPDDEQENGDPHWFYCDKKDGYIYNEGGRDSDGEGGLAYKRIDGKFYFFDRRGHMITGLISTGDADISGSPFIDEGFEDLEGAIGKGNSVKPAGIYYLSQDEKTLGQLQTDKRIYLKDGDEAEYYYLSKTGFAYTNALIKGNIYGPDGAMLHADSDKEVLTLENDVYEIKELDGSGKPKEDAKVLIPAGSQIIVNKSGKVTQKGTVKVDDVSYEVTDYQAAEK